MLTLEGPRIQGVGSTNRGCIGCYIVRPGKHVRLLSMQWHGLPGCTDLGITAANLDDCSVPGVVDLDSIVTGALQRDSNVGGIYLERLVLVETAHVHDGGTRGDVHLYRAIIEVQEREAGGAS